MKVSEILEDYHAIVILYGIKTPFKKIPFFKRKFFIDAWYSEVIKEFYGHCTVVKHKKMNNSTIMLCIKQE